MPRPRVEQPGLVWRRSERSVANGECVEVANEGPEVLIRDSKGSERSDLAF